MILPSGFLLFFSLSAGRHLVTTAVQRVLTKPLQTVRHHVKRSYHKRSTSCPRFSIFRFDLYTATVNETTTVIANGLLFFFSLIFRYTHI